MESIKLLGIKQNINGELENELIILVIKNMNVL